MSGQKPEKTMSSRLLTMKFMQRAAAASASAISPGSSPQTPQQASRPDFNDTPTPSPKRQKLSSSQDSPATTNANAAGDLDAISAAIKADEEKRAAAVARQAAEAGETEWVLQFPGDGRQDEEEEQEYILPPTSMDVNDFEEEGRLSFGGFKRKKRAEPTNVPVENIDQATSGHPTPARNQDDDADIEYNAMLREAKSKADRRDGKQKKKDNKKDRAARSGNGSGAYRTRDKDDMRNVTSISGAGAGGGGRVEKPQQKGGKWRSKGR